MRTQVRAFTLLELLVVVAIIGVLVAMLIPALTGAQETQYRIVCADRMRQIGIALHNYHSDMGCFPNERLQAPGRTFYVMILPYLEAVDQSNSGYVELFCCPSRNDERSGPACDFAAARHDSVAFLRGGFHSILGGQMTGDFGTVALRSYPGTSLDVVQNLDGASNTILLSHKWIDPTYYNRKPASNIGPNAGWNVPYATDLNQLGTNLGHHRYAAGFGPSRDGQGYSWDGNPSSFFGASHVGGSPTLVADGSVHVIAYDFVKGNEIHDNVWTKLWSYDDLAHVSLTD